MTWDMEAKPEEQEDGIERVPLADERYRGKAATLHRIPRQTAGVHWDRAKSGAFEFDCAVS
jgi:hypothetical protein